ncbi:MAG: hypothetical protein QNJ98_08300 [Planctomycetota bacterium]|nr:hypothetical protein [Planctomycetota bacterium]
MPRALSRLLALFVLISLAVAPAHAEDEVDAALEAARKAVEALVERVKAAVQGDDPAAALPLLDELRTAAEPEKTDAVVQGHLAFGIRWVYEAVLDTSEAVITDALRKELATLATAEGSPVRVREEYVELLITDYVEALLAKSPPRAAAELTRLREVMAVKPDSEPIRAGVLRAYAYAHERYGEREAYALARSMLEKIASLALAPDAPEVFRNRYAWVLEVQRRQAVAQGDRAGASAALSMLRGLALREQGTASQRESLARGLRAAFNDAWDADRARAERHIKGLTALAQRPDADDALKELHILALDDRHWRLDQAREVEARRRAYVDVRKAADAAGFEPKATTGVIYALAREQAAQFREKSLTTARLLLAELRELCAREAPAAPHPSLAWGLAWAHHHLGNQGRFEEAEGLLTELAAVAAHPQAERRHRNQLAWALADAIWDVHEGQRERDVEADLGRLRELVRMADGSAWRNSTLLRGLDAAHNIASAADDLERARVLVEEAESLTRHDDVIADELERLLRILADAHALELRLGDEAKAERIEARMTAIADGPQGNQEMRAILRGAWIAAHIAAEKANDPARGLRAFEGLRTWLDTEGATRSADDRAALAVMLYNRHWYTFERGESDAAKAALAALRKLATAPDATPPMRYELVAALRARHYPLAKARDPKADAVLDEMRTLVKDGQAGPKGTYDFARALSWSHAKHGDARAFEDADRELDEMRALAKTAALATVDERMCQTLTDAIWDHVNANRRLDLEAALAELETLATSERAGPQHRRKLAQALTDVHGGVLKGRIKGNAPELLLEIRQIARRPDADVATRNTLAYARSQQYEDALEKKNYGYASGLLESLRAAAAQERASAYEGRRYAYALVDAIWHEGDREQWKPMRTYLARLRGLAERWNDAEMRPLLAWGIRCGHAHTRWEGMDVESEMLVEELRQLVARHPKEAGARRELASALAEHVAYALDEPSDRDAADRPLAELSNLALAPSEDEVPRNHLARALRRLYEWAERKELADQRENAARQLRILARRETATTRQREHLAEVLAKESLRLRIAKRPDDVAALLEEVERLSEAEPRSTDIRGALVRVLEHTAEAEFRADKLERGRPRLERLEALATGDGATKDARDAYARTVYAAMLCLVRTEGAAAGASLLPTLKARWEADGKESTASFHYGLGLVALLKAYREAGDTDAAKQTEVRLRALLDAERENLGLRLVVQGVLKDD